jgi:hypothetical protein
MIFARVAQKRERKLIPSLLYYAREEQRIFSFEELRWGGGGRDAGIHACAAHTFQK